MVNNTYIKKPIKLHNKHALYTLGIIGCYNKSHKVVTLNHNFGYRGQQLALPNGLTVKMLFLYFRMTLYQSQAHGDRKLFSNSELAH